MDLYYNQLNLIMLIDQTGFKGISVTYFSYLLDTFLILSLKLRNSNGGNISLCAYISHYGSSLRFARLQQLVMPETFA